MPTEKERRQFIKQTFDTVAPVYGSGASAFFHKSGEVIAGLLSLSGSESVLDVASGTGATAIPLAKRLANGRVTAVDISNGMLEQARIRAAEMSLNNIHFMQQDMTRLPFASNSFDCATCAFGLFFVDDMSALLAHIATTVKAGGTILVSGFCGDSFQPMARLCLERLSACGVDVPEQVGWQRMAEPDQLEAIFRAAGLHGMQIEHRSLGYMIDLEDWWDVVWNAGFRGLVESLGDKVDEFKRAHLEELLPYCVDNRLMLEVDVRFTQAIKP